MSNQIIKTMQSYYEINISLNGWHFFATANRSITDTNKLQSVLEVIITKFPENEGYKISISYNECKGYEIERKAPLKLSAKEESKTVAKYFSERDYKQG